MKSKSRSKIFSEIPFSLPREFIEELSKWKLIIKSPHSFSYYNAVVNWDYKPANSLRLSDHWNFYSKGKMHCLTSTKVPNITHWTLARYNEERKEYDIIKSLEKDLRVL